MAEIALSVIVSVNKAFTALFFIQAVTGQTYRQFLLGLI